MVREGSFTQREVNAWNGLPGKVVKVEGEVMFTTKLDRYLNALEIDGYGDIGRTCR